MERSGMRERAGRERNLRLAPDYAEPVLGLAKGKTRGLHPATVSSREGE